MMYGHTLNDSQSSHMQKDQPNKFPVLKFVPMDSVEVCLHEILAFSSFVESRKYSEVSSTWHKACRSGHTWRTIDVVGYETDPEAILAMCPSTTVKLRIDVPSREQCTKVLKQVVARPHITSIDIFARSSSGCVFYNSAKVSQFERFKDVRYNRSPPASSPHLQDPQLDVSIHFPADRELLDIISSVGSRVRHLAFFAGIEAYDSHEFSRFLSSISKVQTLMLGNVPSELDFDGPCEVLMAELRALNNFQAENLNICPSNIKRLKSRVQELDVGGVWGLLMNY